MTKSIAQLKADEKLLQKLDNAQRATAINNYDLAHILDITPSYLTVLRRRLQVSTSSRPKFEYVIKTLRLFQKSGERPIFERRHHEDFGSFKKRRAKLVKVFKSSFLTIMSSLNIEE